MIREPRSLSTGGKSLQQKIMSRGKCWETLFFRPTLQVKNRKGLKMTPNSSLF